MKNKLSLLKTTILLFGGLALSSLISCENFLRSDDVKREIEESIAYNNAKEIPVLIQSDADKGTTVPSGNYIAKKGYEFEISFSETQGYSFIEWQAFNKDNESEEITKGVTFEDKNSPKTKVTITNDKTAIKIYPKCTDRIKVSGEPGPSYNPLGVSRDRSITVSFTKALGQSSFIFSPDEIPSGIAEQDIKTDSAGNIWAYTLDGQTFLKNISITNTDDYSIAEHFLQPQVQDNRLTIAVNKTNPITFNIGEVFKTVKVTLSKDIMDTDGVKMNTPKSWNYQITEATDEKATVNLTSVATEGSVYLAGTRDYSISQSITLAFTENANYQFIKWDYDPAIINISQEGINNPNTTAIVIEKTTEDNPTQIKAVCAPRLRDKSFSPVNDNSNPAVSKNSSIVIQFDHNLPTDEAGYAQLQNIDITVGGISVKNNFLSPTINGDTVTFVADKTNMLDVSAGQTRTVSVYIPSDLYYELADGTKISYGGKGKSFDYKINETTIDKAEITITAPAGSGSLTGASGTHTYSIGQEVTLGFEASQQWKFYGWNITCGDEAVSSDKIRIINDTNGTKLVVYEALQGVTVTAKASEKLVITQKTPLSQGIYPKDSKIEITFNKALAAECSSLLNKIQINSGSLDGYYTKRTLSGNKIIIENTTPLEIAKGDVKFITVNVPSDLFYVDGDTTVNLEQESFSYTVNYTTQNKTKVSYSVINGATGQAFNPAGLGGSLNRQAYEELNVGEKDLPLLFAANSGYNFLGWKIICNSAGYTVSPSDYFSGDSSNGQYEIIVKKGDEEYFVLSMDNEHPQDAKLKSVKFIDEGQNDCAISICAKATLAPAIINKSPAYRIEGVECDSKIIIEFNKAMDKDSLVWGDTIQIVDASDDNIPFKKYFDGLEWIGNTLEIKPKNDIRDALVKNAGDLCNIKVKIDYSNIFDLEGNSLEGSAVNNPSWTYRINHSMETVAPTVNMKLVKRGFNIAEKAISEVDDPDYPVKYYAEENGTYTELSTLDFEHFVNATYQLNHVGKKVYFDAQVSDEGSGYNKLTINETLIRTVGGDTAAGAETYSRIIPYSEDSFENALCENPDDPDNPDNPYYIEYIFQTASGGVIQLDFIFEDFAGIPTEKTYYVIHDTEAKSDLLLKDELNYSLKDYKAWPDAHTGSTTEQTMYSYLNREPNANDVWSRNEDSNGKIKEIINFSKQEGFYSNKKVYAKEYLVKWGYSQDSINSLAAKESDRKFSFTRDADKDCYITIITMDAAGNIANTTAKYPKKSSILGLVHKSYNDGRSYDEVKYSNKADGVLIFYKYRADSDSELSEFRRNNFLHSGFGATGQTGDFFIHADYQFKDETLTPSGQYYLYLIPYYKYGNTNNGISYYYGVMSEPLIVYHKVDYTCSTPSFPNDFSYTITDPEEPNGSGIRHVTVTLPDTFIPTEGCTYGILTDGNYFGLNFTIDSMKEYTLKLIAWNKKGDVKQSSVTKTIKTEYDNIVPACSVDTLGFYLSAPNEIVLANTKTQQNYTLNRIPIDDGVGMYKNNGLCEFDYYYYKILQEPSMYYTYNWGSFYAEPLEVTKTLLKQLDKNTVSYSPAAEQVKLNFDCIYEGYYYLIFDLRDQNGNQTYTKSFVSNYVVPKLPKLTITGNSTSEYTITINSLYLTNEKINYNSASDYPKFMFEYCYLSEGEWKLGQRASNLYLQDNFRLTDNKVFLRVGLFGARNSLYNFYCPEYYIKQNAGQVPVCSNKSVIPGLSGGFQVFYDAPCFAHTMAFPTSMLAELQTKTQSALEFDNTLDYETAYTAVWETRGKEYGLQLLNDQWLTATASTSYVAPVAQIPSGYSYVTIFHFADGTTAMSDVKQK